MLSADFSGPGATLATGTRGSNQSSSPSTARDASRKDVHRGRTPKNPTRRRGIPPGALPCFGLECGRAACRYLQTHSLRRPWAHIQAAAFELAAGSNMLWSPYGVDFHVVRMN